MLKKLKTFLCVHFLKVEIKTKQKQNGFRKFRFHIQEEKDQCEFDLSCTQGIHC